MPSDPMLFFEIVGGAGVVIGIIYVFVKNAATGKTERLDLDSKEFPDERAAQEYRDRFDKGANR